MDKRLKLIQPFIYTDFSPACIYEKVITRPFHIRFYELAPLDRKKEKKTLHFSFIASPYTEWIICYDDITYFNGDALFCAVSAGNRAFDMDIPYHSHIFGIRFDDDLFFVNQRSEVTSPSELFNDIYTYHPTGNTYEYHLIEELQQSKSFAEQVRHFLKYLSNSKKRLEIPPPAALIQGALKNAPPDATISEIASEYDYTPRHISRIFKESFGYSPKDYMKLLRIQRVLNAMLENPDETNRFFSKELGYNDTAHFQREFKEFLNITPGEYLQTLKEL